MKLKFLFLFIFLFFSNLFPSFRNGYTINLNCHNWNEEVTISWHNHSGSFGKVLSNNFYGLTRKNYVTLIKAKENINADTYDIYCWLEDLINFMKARVNDYKYIQQQFIEAINQPLGEIGFPKELNQICLDYYGSYQIKSKTKLTNDEENALIFKEFEAFEGNGFYRDLINGNNAVCEDGQAQEISVSDNKENLNKKEQSNEHGEKPKQTNRCNFFNDCTIS